MALPRPESRLLVSPGKALGDAWDQEVCSGQIGGAKSSELLIPASAQVMMMMIINFFFFGLPFPLSQPQCPSREVNASERLVKVH